ncbi:MAG TPA: glucose 1-dehydrogenase [Candidatus Binatia bacterium]|jgi:NAD(P)-dependent dehydrogenase (short-subunit alcohol dehydrogenase family)|nr:glucose 1-dehydrogenase [Candidatus Binatia bacterium]
MAGRLAGKTALITGGGNGIGRATVLRFLEEGARVMAVDLNEETGRETLELAARAGHGERVVQFARADVAEETQVAAATDRAVSHFGRLDCVFNNAGFAGVFGPITHISVEDWDRTFAVLVRGVFLGMKHAARVMKGQGGGTIISTASVAGLGGGDGPQAYSGAKAAVVNLTRAVAIELAAERIRVNAICPGGILTPLLHRGDPDTLRPLLDTLQPWPEHGRPEDIAAAALYLASDDAVFVTGTALVVDGGLTAVGGNTMRRFGGQGMLAATGMDQGTTGLESTMRSLD